MIPNHAQFIAAIHEKKKVRVRFYSKADSGVLDRVCARLITARDTRITTG